MRSPKIRFKGYSEDWEQRKFGEVVDVRSGRDYKHLAEGDIPVYGTGGYMLSVDEALSEDEDAIGIGRKGTIDNPYILRAPFWTVDTLFYVIPRDKYDLNFVFDIFQNVNWKAKDESTGVPSLSKATINEVETLMPKYAEQKKIGEYFSNLDHLITLHQRKCEQTQKLKKYMLQKMFPQDKTNVPKIRFDGFTDAWEQRKLGEITELKSASRVHKDEWTSNGVPFYRSSDVMAAINGTENEKAFISEELYEKLSKVSGKLEEGDILVTGGGSVGNPYIVPDNKPLYTKDADLLWIKNKGKFHPYFLYEFFFSPTFRNYLGSISHVGTIAHYTITQLSETPICLPSFEEQKEVGEYFQSLDHLITLHQQKCDQLQSIKKYMLQNMFV
jgi:type I restriction enzyme S subunit